MSAFSVKYLGVGRNLARIFQVYNNVIYSYLREKKRKTPLFSIQLGRRAQLSALQKPPSRFLPLRANLFINNPLHPISMSFVCALVLKALRFGANCNAIWC